MSEKRDLAAALFEASDGLIRVAEYEKERGLNDASRISVKIASSFSILAVNLEKRAEVEERK